MAKSSMINGPSTDPKMPVAGGTFTGDVGFGNNTISGTGDIHAGNVYVEEINATTYNNLPAADSSLYFVRSNFTYRTATTIYIGAGRYWHAGTTEQWVYWNSTLTSAAIAGAAANTWYYLYIDDSAIITAGTNVLTASELIWSATAPANTMSSDKFGFYPAGSNDRCIFAVRTDDSGNIKKFYHDGGASMLYDVAEVVITVTDIDNVWTDITLVRPVFSTKCDITAIGYYVGASSGQTSWRVNGSSGTGHPLLYTHVEGQYDTNSVTVFTDISGVIEVVMQNSTASVMSVWTCGWYFPEGM